MAAASGLDDVQTLIDRGGHRAVVSAVRADGSVQSSVVVAGVVAHPVTGERVVAFTTPGTSVKLRLLRARPQATIVFQPDYHWASVGGRVDLVGHDDPREGVDTERLRLLLREVFTAAGGSHDDWDAYDRAMAADRRTAVLIRPDRVFAM
ncbi:pyridoxamine 5'-phosphate oxidase family protein [Marinitenerispora sediminis]|uniref:Pyridoxamine 5'-phosphate oxidase n=1 Tax=Marinitenerispora sediminis TaxID=1931232 RepID=A0A368T7P6_9ACTN|nr:pyridoxamine 5'-phosphate oxidase family protein [Marinitenerispora sediminis]RCV50904.1 pyridoxamine 5'-phosphate oxidase [Marinitenerispora sediminis]RCV59736.1 pyridoxamine 5'-phosphate oxidase [Marinitenerispora sediminis]RCV59812.1 pyridoxamine 5'-phosphate oxidase [Marinitenerispora sediminis]